MTAVVEQCSNFGQYNIYQLSQLLFAHGLKNILAQ